MKSILLKNVSAILPNEKRENANILIESGVITEISPNELKADEVINFENNTLYSGFIDIHNHGAVGVDTNEANLDEFVEVGKFLAKNGVTAWLPTFVPDSDENYQRQIDILEKLRQIQSDLPIAQVVGVHYEGVFANTQMCGALRPQYFKTFTRNELNELPTLKNAVHHTTYAPEIEGGIELTKELTKRSWIPSIGHTKADFQTLENAFSAGAKHITHLFNAMTGVHHRDLGVAGWALTKDEIFCEIIADCIHVHPKMLKFAAKNKPSDKLILVSDSVSPTGLGDGNYEIWGEKVSVVQGKTQNERGSIAGSVITVLDAVKNMLKLGFSEVEVSKMASANPASLLGIEKEFGSIEVGKRADLVVLDEKNDVILSLVNGRVAFSRDQKNTDKN
ncbi:MAG: N-acetylglucosamine-6-phosphate deacetylase [Pyrinomonadaceae bacterium]|nr:N-acetylglucosamine-6-phosphate deacetylase [Pyrinomonadaceae bacterium]